jgi:hypothetical protein
VSSKAYTRIILDLDVFLASSVSLKDINIPTEHRGIMHIHVSEDIWCGKAKLNGETSSKMKNKT